jgi:putative nucleotidyltransferase with HDIG domain
MLKTDTPSKQVPAGERRVGVGGRKLAAAFDSVSTHPVLAEARFRLLALTDREGSSTGDVAEAIETDAGLAIAVMRAANNGQRPVGGVGGVPAAVEILGVEGVGTVALDLDTYDPLNSPALSAAHERFRRHAVATRIAADRIAELARLDARDDLAVAALLHDVGHLVLDQLYGESHAPSRAEIPPEERLRRERREHGVDHALVGAVLVRRWGVPQGIAQAIERHHASDAKGHAAAIRLADLVVHHVSGEAATPDAMLEAAQALGLGEPGLRDLLYEYPYPSRTRRRSTEPCPLSARELDALRGLAEGKVYKQIAHELTLSVSTIRTHLHNVYRKVGAVDRAQAVLIATERGWL